jgi:serine phosphatase RsbU (regulator of sigma subunit)
MLATPGSEAGEAAGRTGGDNSGVAVELDAPVLEEETAALEAIASGVRSYLAGAGLDDVLVRILGAAAQAAGAELAVVRVAGGRGELLTRAVYGSPVVAAELVGARLSAAELEAPEREYAPVDREETPRAIRRAAELARARSALVHVVESPEGAVAAVELYREDPVGFSPRERAVTAVAAAQTGLLLALADGAAEAAAEKDGTRVPLELVGDALAAGSDETELAEQVVRIAADATGAVQAVLWRVEGDLPAEFLAAHGFRGDTDDLAVAAERVRTALEERGVGKVTRSAKERVLLALGEPPAGALELTFADGSEAASLEHLSGFAARVAIALRRARRADLVALALRRSQTIVAVVSQAIARLSLSHTLETAVERISELTASSHVAIYLREGEGLHAAAVRGLVGAHTDLAERLLELALGPFRSRGFLFIDDLRRDPRLGGLEDVLEETGVRRALVIPLLVHEEVIGALAVFKARPRPYRPGEEGLLIALSSQLAVAVQNARLHERTKELGAVLERALASERKAARQLRGLFDISHSFARSLSLEATLEAVAKTMVDLFGVDAAAIRMPDERGTALVPRAIHVADSALREAACVFLSRPQALDEPLLKKVLSTGEAVVLSGRNGVDRDALLEPFLHKGSTAAVLPLATPAESVGTLTLLSLDPDRPLDAETVDTAVAVAAQAALAIDNARLYQQQKDFSETMQRSLLPSELPAVPGLDVGHVYDSSARVDVGGDVYDFMSLDEGCLAVVVGDVAGKGIQAAADMAMAKFAFRSLARSYPDPSEFLAKANEVVTEEIALGKFITMLYVLVDVERREAAWASAGHPPARLVRPDGSITSLTGTGLALGVEPEQRYEAERVSLEPGASVVLYTDGVIEARRDGDLYGEARLDAFLRENSTLSAQQLADALLSDCRFFSGGDLADDCAVVVLRIAP